MHNRKKRHVCTLSETCNCRAGVRGFPSASRWDSGPPNLAGPTVIRGIARAAEAAKSTRQAGRTLETHVAFFYRTVPPVDLRTRSA